MQFVVFPHGLLLTQAMSSLGSMSLLSRMALSTAEPSLPVALVRAIIFDQCSLQVRFSLRCQLKLLRNVNMLGMVVSAKC